MLTISLRQVPSAASKDGCNQSWPPHLVSPLSVNLVKWVTQNRGCRVETLVPTLSTLK